MSVFEMKFMQNVVRKIERQYIEVAGADAEVLRVANEMTVENYLRNFQWDYARYRYQGRQLPDLVSQIQTMVAKVDDELKKLSSSYNEKVQTLSALQRKRTVNLATSDFEDFLSAEKVAKMEFMNTEYFQTLVVVVNSQTEPGSIPFEITTSVVILVCGSLRVFEILRDYWIDFSCLWGHGLDL